MDVLVCATQVPFMRGGLELMVENLVDAFGAAGHRAEAVSVPAAWDKDRLLDAALAWRMIPLDADVVIPVNFPAYFARHPRKVLWLAHQHRAAYDALGQPWSDFGLDDASLEAHRQLVDWDVRALGEAMARFTISKVVATRMRTYCGLSAQALYQPPPLADRLKPRTGGRPGSHILCPTRLEANKRPGLFVDAVAAMSLDTPAVLAGRGSLADDLAASVDRLGLGARLDLPGFVSDDDLVELFRDAIAVVYAPYDEDYGFVTLQAFLAGVPVVTTDDSGGVLEWVTDGVTGLVTDGSPAAMGAALDRLVQDPDLAARLGAAGRERVASLSWEHVVTTLLGGAPR
jgi:glycosyltransferase involved in cell wall biosynthesis